MADGLSSIDVWMQHPTPCFMGQPMFESLRRWMGMETPVPEIPLEFTIQAMDAAQVGIGLISAWHGPLGPLISNEEVAAGPSMRNGWPGLRGQPGQADGSRPRLRRCVRELGFKAPYRQWLWNLTPNGAIIIRMWNVSNWGTRMRRSAIPVRCVLRNRDGHTVHRRNRAGFPRADHRRRPYRLSVDPGNDRRGHQTSECIY